MTMPLCAARSTTIAALIRRFVDEHRAEPLDHPLLHVDRAHRAGVGDDAQAGDVVAAADGVGQVEHPHEVRGHHQARLGPLLVDGLQRALGVEAPEAM